MASIDETARIVGEQATDRMDRLYQEHCVQCEHEKRCHEDCVMCDEMLTETEGLYGEDS
jgi:hypothetical protein